MLLGEAQSDPDLRSVFDLQRQSFVDSAELALSRLDIADPRRSSAEAVVLTVEALIVRQVIIGNMPLDPDALRLAIERMLSPLPERNG